jgi:hypothetical protein
MVLQDPREIAEAVKKTLETQGTLSKIRAQLRAHVVSVLDNELPKPLIQRSTDGISHSYKAKELKAIDAIYECLAYLKLTSTMSVFEAETRQLNHSLPETNVYKKPAILQWIESQHGILQTILKKDVSVEKEAKKEAVKEMTLKEPVPMKPKESQLLIQEPSKSLPPIKLSPVATRIISSEEPISSTELFDEDINAHLDQDAELLRDFNRIKNEKFHERTTDFDSEPSFEEEIIEDVVAESEPDEFELSDLVTTDRTVSPTWKVDAFDHHEAVLKK